MEGQDKKYIEQMQKNFAEYKQKEKSKEEEKEAHKNKIESMMVSPF